MDQIPVFESSELPKFLKAIILKYYEGTDQRDILNNSYTRYPYLFDWQEGYDFKCIDFWFNAKIDCMAVGYVIIHWEL